jgi:hypothetical protein
MDWKALNPGRSRGKDPVPQVVGVIGCGGGQRDELPSVGNRPGRQEALLPFPRYPFGRQVVTKPAHEDAEATVFVDLKFHRVFRGRADGHPRPVAGKSGGKSRTGRPDREIACIREGRDEASRRGEKLLQFRGFRAAGEYQEVDRSLLTVDEVQEHLRAGG